VLVIFFKNNVSKGDHSPNFAILLEERSWWDFLHAVVVLPLIKKDFLYCFSQVAGE
jgi:hypothetical protein